MRTRTRLFALVASALLLGGCGHDEGTDAAEGTDAGTDAAAIDPCAANQTYAATTVGCNGPPLGPGAAPNDFGGLCTPDMMMTLAQGSCTAATDVCASSPGNPVGMCVRRCDPAASYVSTGTCPMGSRCFTIDPVAGNVFCYPDCNTGADCTTMTCDGEGGCVPAP